MDILIVGGGPAGSLSAFLLGEEYDAAVFEEHQSTGFPVQCAGLISDRCFEKLGKYCRIGKTLENEIKGAFFISPRGKPIEARGKAFVVERKLLDEMLFERASERAEVFVKEKVRFEGRKLKTPLREMEGRFIIGADGVYSTVARHFNFPRPSVFTSLQAEMKFEPLDENYVELYFGSRWSDSFFAYAIPLGDTARVGVLSRTNPEFYFKNLIEKHPSVSGRVRGSMVELNAGAVPDRLVDFVNGRIALIGDSAGMVKPYTGGGLYYLTIAAEKLAESFPDLKKYRESYMKETGKEYRYGYLIRKLYTLSDDKLEALFSAMTGFDFRGTHMDSPSSLGRKATVISIKLLKRPILAFSLIKHLLF